MDQNPKIFGIKGELKVCLVSNRKMQNTNYFGMIRCKILKFLGLCLVPSKMQNLLLSLGFLEALLLFLAS